MISNKAYSELVDDPETTVRCEKSGTFTPQWLVISFCSPNDLIARRFFSDANHFVVEDANRHLIDTTQHIVTTLNRKFTSTLEETIDKWKTSKEPAFEYAAQILDKAKRECRLDEEKEMTSFYHTYKFEPEELLANFEDYRARNKNALDEIFNENPENQGRCCVRGFKVRGVFEKQDEAREHSRKIREAVPEPVDVFVAPMWRWIPWNPNPNAIDDQEYISKNIDELGDLNDLMRQKRENEKMKEEFFNKRKADMVENAHKENAENARKQLLEKLKAKKEKVQHK